MIYRVLLVFLVQLLFGTISFRSPKALLNVLIHLFYLFDLKWSLKCYLSAIIDQGDIYNRTFAWLLTKLVFECKLIHWEQRSSVIQATQKSASHVASHMSISQHDNQHDIQMPYFNSWTSVFLLKLLILSGTLKKVSIVSNSHCCAKCQIRALLQWSENIFQIIVIPLCQDCQKLNWPWCLKKNEIKWLALNFLLDSSTKTHGLCWWQ